MPASRPFQPVDGGTALNDVTALLQELARGGISAEAAGERLVSAEVIDLGFARIDAQRELRQGEPEAVLAEGKLPEQVAAIVASMLEREIGTVLVTRADVDVRERVAALAEDAEEDALARLVWVQRERAAAGGRVAVVSAGTADGAVAHEVAVTARLFGAQVSLQEDLGVAGLHRLAIALPDIRSADCVVVVAGQDAALASVVGGLVPTPVIAVPVSSGYGVAAGGYTALMSMLASCAPGVAVVNIDDGFGAATIAARVARAAAGHR